MMQMEQEEAVEMLRGGKEALILAILAYLRTRPGNTASSPELVGHFKPRLAPDDALLFRSMLKQIATFDKTRKMWTLKSEFDEREE